MNIRPPTTYSTPQSYVDPWVVPAHDKEKYLTSFRANDVTGTGFITGLQAKALFESCGVPTTVLAQIWRLADMDKDGRLSPREYIILMFLIDCQKRGVLLPPIVPDALASSSVPDRAQAPPPAPQTYAPPPTTMYTQPAPSQFQHPAPAAPPLQSVGAGRGQPPTVSPRAGQLPVVPQIPIPTQFAPVPGQPPTTSPRSAGQPPTVSPRPVGVQPGQPPTTSPRNSGQLPPVPARPQPATTAAGQPPTVSPRTSMQPPPQAHAQLPTQPHPHAGAAPVPAQRGLPVKPPAQVPYTLQKSGSANSISSGSYTLQKSGSANSISSDPAGQSKVFLPPHEVVGEGHNAPVGGVPVLPVNELAAAMQKRRAASQPVPPAPETISVQKLDITDAVAKPISLEKKPEPISLTKEAPAAVSLAKPRVIQKSDGNLTQIQVLDAQIFTLENRELKPFYEGSALLIFTEGKEQRKGELRLGNGLAFPLSEQVPFLQTKPLHYLFSHDHVFYAIVLSAEPEDSFHDFLTTCSYYHVLERQPDPDAYKEMEGSNEHTERAQVAAKKIDAGGVAASQGIIKGATVLGKGVRKITDTVVKNSDKGEAREVTAQERADAERKEKMTKSFLSGTRSVTGGIAKGAKFVGQGIAKGANKVTETDMYKEKAGPEKPESAKKNAAINVGKSAGGAIGSVIKGVTEGTKIVAADVRDGAVDVKRHKEGDEAAAMHERSFNMAGQVSIGVIHTANIATVSKSAVKVVLIVGVEAATYDAEWLKLVAGAPWHQGWLSSQENTMDPWLSNYFVLRTYALCIYKDPNADMMKPMTYVPLIDIRSVDLVDERVTRQALSFQIVTRDNLFYVSCKCTDRPGITYSMEDVHRWIQKLRALMELCRGIIVTL